MTMKELIEQKKWLLVKAGLSLGSFLIFIVVLWSQAIAIWENWSEVKSRQMKVEEARAWKDVTHRVEQENNMIKADLTALYQKVPQNEVLSGIINFLQRTGKEAGIRFIYVKPERPRKLAHYEEISFELGLKGYYHNLGKFLFSLESSENVIRVQSLEMTTKDMITKELNIDLKISVFLINTL